LLAVLQRVALVIGKINMAVSSKSWSTKVLHCNTTTTTLRHNLQMHIMILIIIFASTMNSHVGVASHGNMRYYVASANQYHNSGYHVQGLISTMIFSSFNATSNIQHAYSYSSAIGSQYVVSPQNKPMNERIGYANNKYTAKYSQFSYGARYANRTKVPSTNSASDGNDNVYDSISYVINNYSRINENSARYVSTNAHHSASHITDNYSRSNENSAPYRS
jgi:hypothetical protein